MLIRSTLSLACYGALAALSASAQAADDPKMQPVAPPAEVSSAKANSTEPVADAVAGSQKLDGVTIVGERRSNATAGVLGNLKLIDAPFAISVLPREVLDLQQAASYSDYLKNEPSATLGNVPVGFTTLRGFSVGYDGYLYDGLVGAPGLSDGRNQIEGVDRIEVLKGPSAFLYGVTNSSSLGGSINYVPKRPTEEAIRRFSVNYTSDSLYGATADVGDRFGTDRAFGYRVNLGYKNGDTAVDGYGWKHRAATIALDWHASPNLVFNAGLEYAANEFPRLQPFYVLAPGLAVPEAPDSSHNVAQPWDNRFGVVSTVTYLRADWTISDDWSLTAQGLRGIDRRRRIDESRFGFITDNAGDVLQFVSRDQSRSDGETAQILVHGNVVTGPFAHQLTLGATATNASSNYGSTPQGANLSNLYSPVNAPAPGDVDVTTGLVQKVPTTSFLVSDIVTFTPQWSALAGVRHVSIKTENYDVATNSLATSDTVTRNSPIAALMFKPMSNALVYASYAEGLEQGGTAPAGSANANQVLPAVVTRQFEVGAKLDTGKVTYTTALFNLRRPREFVDPTSLVYAQNGIEQHRGIEFSVYGRVTPALLIVAGTMLLDPTVKGTGDPTTEGRDPAGVARRTANLFADYRIGAIPGLFVNGGIYANGPQFLDAQNLQRVPGYARVDAGLRYETRVRGNKTAFLLGVENLAGRSYWAGAQSGILTLADPRTVKATVNTEF